jgi:predicted nucleic acid-binding Zn ribbon protein
MMYDYRCEKCENDEVVIKPASDYNKSEFCQFCQLEMIKVFSKTQIICDKSSYEYCHSLGQIVKNNRHRRELAKERGMVEVGTETPEKIHAKNEKDLNEKIQRRWDEV